MKPQGTGSSPHTRDKFNLEFDETTGHRIIPAYAGQMYTFQQIHKFVQDHPRIRGTNGHITNLTGYRLGSSPHTRDKCLFFCLVRLYIRIIPAYAGQIFIEIINLSYREDHPRIRGTNLSTPVTPIVT